MTLGDVVQVNGFHGVACRFAGMQMRRTIDDDGDVFEEETGLALVVMIGDDHKHAVDLGDMSLLAEDAYCDGCGQVGCGHGSQREA